jgi:predicted dehydrogenase
MATPFSASVVGGGAGGKLSMAGLTASGNFNLVAAADLQASVRQELQALYPGLQVYPDHHHLFAEQPTDIVCVSTYAPSHEEVTLDALKLPLKGILVEKPLGDTVASGRRVVEAIKARGLPMIVPHGLLVRRTPIEIIERVRNGDIGELKLVEIENRQWDIFNAGIHWLNYFIALTNNEPMDYVMALAESSMRTYRDGMQVETTAVTYGQTRNGIRVVMNTGDDVLVNRPGKDTLFRVIGTHGLIEFWGWEERYFIQNRDHPTGAMISPEPYPGGHHQRHLDALAAMIEMGRPDYRVAESSLMALEIVEAAYLSSRHRCKVTFPLEDFTPPVETNWNPGAPYSGSGGGRDGRKL